MWMWALVPFLLQAVAIGVDEIHFHWKRGLPLWERLGHPLDTLSLLVCIGMTIFTPFTVQAFWIYCALAVVSCLMVTKDEFVHKHHCCGAENWLHALLFILHPITLIVIALIWPISQNAAVPSWFPIWFDTPEVLKAFLYFQGSTILMFFLYQLIFWNIVWRKTPTMKQ